MAEFLYVHIPFCICKCKYCDFYSIVYDDQLADQYVSALMKELTIKKEEIDILRGIYIGGGTPGILKTNTIAGLIDFIYSHFTLHNNIEITIESNPGAIDHYKSRSLKSAGINRFSLGVQSFIERELLLLGRAHDSAQAQKAIESVGNEFDNFSIDLMYAIPGQEIEDWTFNLASAVDFSPPHISAYELTIEQDTPFESLLRKGDIKPMEDEVLSDIYYNTIERLGRAGFRHYEISNYACPGYECTHNLNYWRRGEYAGVGASAHSHIKGRRYSNVKDLKKYIYLTENSLSATVEETLLSERDIFSEQIFLGLRTSEGVSMDSIDSKSKTIETCREMGFIETGGNRIKLTDKGMLLSNQVISSLLFELGL